MRRLYPIAWRALSGQPANEHLPDMIIIHKIWIVGLWQVLIGSAQHQCFLEQEQMALNILLTSPATGELSSRSCVARAWNAPLDHLPYWTFFKRVKTHGFYLVMFDKLSLWRKIYRTIDHLSNPHHGVGMTCSWQNGFKRQGKLQGCLIETKLLTSLGDGAEKHVVSGQSLDGLDQHCIHSQLQIVAELIGREEFDVLVHNDGAAAVVDAISAIFSWQPRLFTFKQLPEMDLYF